MQFHSLVSIVGKALVDNDALIVTAESCTGGMIAEALTEVAGSTAWFDRAFITYSYESKQEMIGVNLKTIQRHGAVSKECVEEMALGALKRSNAKVSVACSGIAGPGGGSSDKPVGMVWLAWAKVGASSVQAQCFQFDGDRQSVRMQTTEEALQGVIKLLNF